ncbi:hypothetical protein, partial [Moraxella catarrhalis]|uniref:hypothetical protein n=1 Tax=Moraxella catarrhalis TaxID=480 RepID=UPI001D0D84F0
QRAVQQSSDVFKVLGRVPGSATHSSKRRLSSYCRLFVDFIVSIVILGSSILTFIVQRSSCSSQLFKFFLLTTSSA